MKKHIALAVLFMVLASLFFLARAQKSSQETIIDILGFAPPKVEGANEIHLRLEMLDETKSVRMWIRVQMPLDAVEKYMKKLMVDRLDEKMWVEFPEDSTDSEWWTLEGDLRDIKDQWMRVDTGGNITAAQLKGVWVNNSLFLYYYGQPRQMAELRSPDGWGRSIKHDPETDKPSSR